MQFQADPCCGTCQYLIHFSCWILSCCMDTAHFMYPPINPWTFCLFMLLVIVTNVAVNICMKYLYGHVSFSEYTPRSRIGRSQVTLCLTFWETSRLFAKLLHDFVFPLGLYERSISSSPCNPNYRHTRDVQWWLIRAWYTFLWRLGGLSIFSCAHCCI